MVRGPDVIVVACAVAGAAVGLLIGLLVSNPGAYAAVGAMSGLILGSLLTVLPPRASRGPSGSARSQDR